MDFQRYLAAKKSVDDRALNHGVWTRLTDELSVKKLTRPVRVLELGCGIGTMVERLLEWGLAKQVLYLGIDSEEENIQTTKRRIFDWGTANGYMVSMGADAIVISQADIYWQIIFQHADVTTYQTQPAQYDVLIAQAFLDLIDIPKMLPTYKNWLAPEGLFYFTINFDGETIFEPVSDPEFESKIMNLYHQSMDERIVDGQTSGDSRAGRHLFHHLLSTGAQILAAGSSDWVVYPDPDGYPDDEAFFLHCILDFFDHTLSDHPAFQQGEFSDWLRERRHQIDQGKLIYIAHQLDFLGRF